MNGGDKKGFFSDLNGVVKDYWFGGNGVVGMCGCGLIKICVELDKNVRYYNSQKNMLKYFKDFLKGFINVFNKRKIKLNLIKLNEIF